MGVQAGWASRVAYVRSECAFRKTLNEVLAHDSKQCVDGRRVCVGLAREDLTVHPTVHPTSPHHRQT